MSDAIDLFHSQEEQLEPIYKDFKERRDRIDNIIMRKGKIDLEDELAPYARSLQVQSVDAERALHQAIQILTMNPTKLDLICQDDRKEAKDDIEDIRIWDGTFWRKQNDKRRLDRARAESQYRYGVAIERLFWDMPGEYEKGEAGELPDGAEEMTEEQLAKKSKAEREAYFKGLNSDHWLIQPVNPKTCMWLPVNSEPELFFEKSEISYAEATKLRNASGEFFTLDEAGKVLFLGERAPVSEKGKPEHKITVTTRAMKNKDTGKWTIANFVTVEGGSGGKETEQLDEADVPGDWCPYFVIPSGNELPSETDPNLRYRPPIFPLVEAVNRMNFQVTRMTALMMKYSDNFYADLSTATTDQLREIDMLSSIEGVGADRGPTIEIRRPGSNEIAAHLHVERYPFQLDESMKWVLDQNQKAIDDAMPSRFQTGDVSRVEATNETATTMVNLLEQSALPWETHLANADGYGTAAELEAVHSCISYWSQAEEGDTVKPYFTASTGDEPLLKGAPEAGTQVYIDANKLKRPFQIVVQTANKTQAEKQQDLVTTLQLSAKEWITDEQALERTGFDDPRKQLELLEAERQRKDGEPFKRQMITQMRQQLLTALLGAPPPAGLMQAPMGPGAPALGAGSGPPGGAPAPPAPNQGGPQVTPAPVTMQGGSNGSVPMTP